MPADIVPFFLGFAGGLVCCVVSFVLLLRALRPLLRRTRSLQAQIESLNLEQAKCDARRLAEATARISQLRASVRG